MRSVNQEIDGLRDDSPCRVTHAAAQEQSRVIGINILVPTVVDRGATLGVIMLGFHTIKKEKATRNRKLTVRVRFNPRVAR